MPKISIIMPVYNSEEYIENAVNSILSQDFKDYELILVDDGSQDNSGNICDQFSLKFPQIKVVHKENGGICSARNAGIKVAKGKYIGFCDNDDEYLPHLLKDNYELAEKYDVDLMRYSKCKYIVKENGKAIKNISKIEDMFIDEDCFYKYYTNIRKEDSIWTGLYKKEIIEQYNIYYDESFRYGAEDANFNLKFLMHCKKLGFNSKCYYQWFQRYSHSTSRKFYKEYLDDYITNAQLEYELMEKIGIQSINQKQKCTFLVNSYIYPIIEYLTIPSCHLSLKEKCAFLEEYRNQKIFNFSIKKETLNILKKENKKVYLTFLLFSQKKFKALLFMVGQGTKLLSLLRFK